MILSYIMKQNFANKNNYGSGRSTSTIKFIVIHYTGNDGDSDESNAKYFRNNIVKASAHYFVDDDSVTQSVPDEYVAWSVGGKKYANAASTGGGKFYGTCTNSNSISIELCDSVKNGIVKPTAKTIQNAIDLTKTLMQKYKIPASNVIRHFDVTGKICPAYWAGTAQKNALWLTEFWNKLNTASSGSTAPTASVAATQSSKSVQVATSYVVQITADSLNVRAGAGATYKVVTTVKKGQKYTIIAEKNGWGMLKSGAGWISLNYAKKV